MSDIAAIVVAVATVLNTALLVWSRAKLRAVHREVTETRTAAGHAADVADVVAFQLVADPPPASKL